MGSTTWLDFLLLAIVSSMQLPLTDLPRFYQVTILNWLVAYWQNMIFEVLQASNFYVQHAPISLAEVVKSCLRTAISGQFEANMNCSSTHGSFSACVFVRNFELSAILIYKFFMMKFMKPLERIQIFLHRKSVKTHLQQCRNKKNSGG